MRRLFRWLMRRYEYHVARAKIGNGAWVKYACKASIEYLEGEGLQAVITEEMAHVEATGSRYWKLPLKVYHVEVGQYDDGFISDVAQRQVTIFFRLRVHQFIKKEKITYQIHNYE